MSDTIKPSSRSSRRSRVRLISVAAILAVAAAGGFVWKAWSGSTATGIEYIFATAQRGDFEDLVAATGALQPRDYVDVGAQVSGQLRRLHVEVGNDVTEGQLLAEIDAEQSVARVEASRASLRAQQAQLVQSEVNLKKAERDFERLQNLLKADATTLELVQNAETLVETTRAQIETQKAQIEQLQASMRVDESNLKYTKIYAPMSGTVVSITAKQGQTLNTNQSAPTILRIADLSVMTVQTQVSEADVTKLRTGVPAYFTTLGSQGQRWYGQLAKIEPTPTVTNNVVLYNALFDVDNSSRSLMAQMTAQVFFIVAEARDTLLVPMSAVTFERVSQPRREGAPQDRNAAPGLSGEGGRPGAGERVRGAAGARAGDGQARSEVGASPETAAAGADGEPRQRPMRPRNAGSGAGQGAGAGPRPGAVMPRRATVKLAAGDGDIVEREVVVGVNNRVQAQILSGLEEGERVVVGIRPPAAQRSSFSQSGSGMPPGAGPGMGPGMGPGGPGR
ncbi:efflux RND transporter periplasmic adaptor subunit [Rhizobiaceae bacterium BDR2-2]|uniref:Efflux RND transporter periplasmic adaptor subunit n=1 Tax=Ectorhizobium quercum TaxID=2965071 RepID=A0AAE3MW03_9HYPH|nr:efflux RND transporter periplasmic adaptor subunit [Ectorhizobium quercum]MCX8995968.1 efflux RND transporter periplasmic adaptor subunit [Ectorhizobium quercum]